jgi:stage II sporulation protein D
VRLRDNRGYRFAALPGNRIRVIDTVTGRTRARLAAPLIVTGGSSTVLHGAAENGLAGGAYRGRMVLVRAGGGVLAVNHVSLEHYLYGVVPAEMPAGWPAEALQAQAVVARSYALTSRRAGEPYDVFADVRSQVYRGVLAEVDTTTAAVRATRARVVTVGREVAQTFFFSTSGGRTATNEEAFGGTPLSYLRSVEDPYDDLSPVHTWSAHFTRREAERRLRSVLSGDLEALTVATRTPSGRAATVEVRGSEGTRVVSAGTIRTLLGLRSTWITRLTGP